MPTAAEFLAGLTAASRRSSPRAVAAECALVVAGTVIGWYLSLRSSRRSVVSGEQEGKYLRRQPDESTPINGTMVAMSHGDTFVQIDGENNPGPWVVLIHGNTGSTWYLEQLAQRLAAQGKKVLRYDLYGRGWSSCGGHPHTQHLFVGQLAEVLFSQGITGVIDLIGYSIGGQVALLFAAKYANKLRTLTLISPAVATPPSWALLLAQSNWSKLFAGALVKKALVKRDRYASDWVDLQHSDPEKRAAAQQKLDALFPTELDRFENEPALFRSFTLTLGGMPWLERPEYIRILNNKAKELRLPIHVLWGELDTITKVGDADKLGALLPHAVITRLPLYGHSLPYEHPGECCTFILDRLGVGASARL